MANAQYIYSPSKQVALWIGVRWLIQPGRSLFAQDCPFPRRSEVRHLVYTWLAEQKVEDPVVTMWGYEDLPWEMFIGTDGGDPDLQLVSRPGWSIFAIDYGPNDECPPTIVPWDPYTEG